MATCCLVNLQNLTAVVLVVRQDAKDNRGLMGAVCCVQASMEA